MSRNHFRKKYCAQSGTLGKDDYGKSFCSFKAGTTSHSLISAALITRVNAVGDGQASVIPNLI